MIELSGVLSSWLMTDKKTGLGLVEPLRLFLRLDQLIPGVPLVGDVAADAVIAEEFAGVAIARPRGELPAARRVSRGCHFDRADNRVPGRCVGKVRPTRILRDWRGRWSAMSGR